ncbi:MAG: 50S ribosomal protein L10 [Myxococcota bacterium]
MNREEKAAQVSDLHARFAATPLVVLADFKGSTVLQMDAIRRGCEKSGVFFRVVKNTLAVRALEGTGKEKLADHFRGNIGVLIANEDAIATAKLVGKYAKENDKLLVRAGFFEGDLLDTKGVAAVAELPSKEELQSRLLATIQQAPRTVMQMIQAPARDLLYLLRNYETKLETQG